jgi:dTDP-4-dehydrorhamnose reductase
MKVLILGHQGNLGTQLFKVFKADNNYEAIGLDRSDFDLLNPQSVVGKINEVKPAIIINATAYNAVDKCEEDAEEFALAKKINGEAVGYIAAAALEAGALFIHYSTDYVFAGDNQSGYKEDDAPAPINNYGRSKLLGEEAVTKKSEQGLKYYLIRTSKLFGPRGLAPASKPSFFDLMLDLANKKDELEIVNEEVSAFTYTPDLALKTKELIDKKAPIGIYHLVNSQPATWYEAASELFKIKGIHVKIEPVASTKFPRPALRPKYSYLLNTKFIALRDYPEALKDYLNNN